MGNLFDGQSDFNDQFKILNYEFETFTKFPQDITNTSSNSNQIHTKSET